jgi:N-acylneuraminate cytidylyltransferase
MKTCAFIFARGGSKGVPGKNIREISGKPLLAYSIELANGIKVIDQVFVSTDDPAIAAVALRYGAEVIDRPAELARDDTPEWLAWQHAVSWLQKQGRSFEVFLSLPATAPLRNAFDVRNCLDKLEEGFDCVITMTETNRSPWFNMVKRGNEDEISLLMDGSERIVRRQDAPKAYDMTTVAYVTRPAFIMNHQGIWDGLVGGVVIPAERALDIDTELDLQIAEFLMRDISSTNKEHYAE